MSPFFIGDKSLELTFLHSLIENKREIQLSKKSIVAIQNCRRFLDQKLKEVNDPIYGINTGFGYLQNVVIAENKLTLLQHNLLLSHACGTGEQVPPELVKLMLLLKIQSLAAGNSGISLEVVERLILMYNSDIIPVIYTQGSLGASGDLAPLAHLSLPLIGEGQVYRNGTIIASSVWLNDAGLSSISLRSKEGLALINGTQFMTAYGVHLLIHSWRLSEWADKIGAMSADAFHCRIDPFKPLSHAIRPHKGQVETAERLFNLLQQSEIMSELKDQVQDPYSFRCMPQVHGASKDTIRYVESIFRVEMNSVTDNPNIFPENDEIISAGNFHGQPLALGLDFLAIALAELGSISERRIFQLVSGQRDLPNFLIKNAGLNSGLMIPQYTAASIVSENKQLCTPASVDSIVSSNGQEDHVSMGANAATKCLRVMNNLERVLAIELITAAQALEFRRPSKTSPLLESIVKAFRKVVSTLEEDRIQSVDIANAILFLRKNNENQ